MQPQYIGVFWHNFIIKHNILTLCSRKNVGLGRAENRFGLAKYCYGEMSEREPAITNNAGWEDSG